MLRDVPMMAALFDFCSSSSLTDMASDTVITSSHPKALRS